MELSTSAPLLISPSCPVPTVFAGRLPQPTRLPLVRSRRFRHASGVGSEEAHVVAEPPRAALGHRSASADVVASIVRSDCYRLE